MFSRPTGFPLWLLQEQHMTNTTHCPRMEVMGRPIKCYRNQQMWVGDRARNELVRLWNWLEYNLPG